jgi:hypothetical protein
LSESRRRMERQRLIRASTITTPLEALERLDSLVLADNLEIKKEIERLRVKVNCHTFQEMEDDFLRKMDGC